jgi:hypothetical protein
LSEHKRKKPRSPFGIFDFDDESFLFGRRLNSSKGEGGSGYSISATYDKKGQPAVKVETYGNVDVTKLRHDIKQRYPRAKIEGLEKQPMIRIVEEEKKRSRNPKRKRKNTGAKKRKKRRRNP